MINRREASYGTCKNEKTCRDAEAAAREGGGETAGEEGRLRAITAFLL